MFVIVCVINQSGTPPFLKLERFSSGRRAKIDDTCSMCDDDRPHICHNHHNHWLCKSFESRVKFSTGYMKESDLSVIFYSVCNLTHVIVIHPPFTFTQCVIRLVNQHTYNNFHTVHDLSSRMEVYAVLLRGNFCCKFMHIQESTFNTSNCNYVKKKRQILGMDGDDGTARKA